MNQSITFYYQRQPVNNLFTAFPRKADTFGYIIIIIIIINLNLKRLTIYQSNNCFIQSFSLMPCIGDVFIDLRS